MRIFTSRYSNGARIIQSGLAPIRTTVGHPRFKLAYKLVGNFPELAPEREMMGWRGERFESAYRQKLDEVGVDYYRGLFKGYPTGVVLLCFEDVWEGKQCHRRIFAQWWEEQTGQVVPELLPPAVATFQASLDVAHKAETLVARFIDDDLIQVVGEHGLYLVYLDNEGLPVVCTCEGWKKNRKVLCSHRIRAFTLIEAEL